MTCTCVEDGTLYLGTEDGVYSLDASASDDTQSRAG